METKIKELRARKNLTQEQLADLVWVRRETIVFLEKWKYNPSLILSKKISIILWEKIDDIFIFEDSDFEW
jgi:DNA-binding XRE family transcriptional regulator